MQQPGNSFVQFSSMSPGLTDYEARFTCSPQIHLSELHNHRFFEIYFHVSGGKTLYADGEVYRMEPNTFIVFPPFRLHGILGESLKDYTRGFLYITPELLSQLGLGTMRFDKLFDPDTSGTLYVYPMDAPLHRRCTQLIQEIQALQDTACEGGLTQLQIYGRILELLMHIAQVMERRAPQQQSYRGDGTARAVARYINEHFKEDLSLDQLAEVFSVSKSCLCHKFVAQYRCSVYQYIQHRRLSRAKELMVSDLPLTAIAYESGYGDYSSFLRAFARYADTTPTLYRKQLQGRHE